MGLSDRRPAWRQALDDPPEVQRVAGALLQEVLRRAHLCSAPDLAAVLAEEARSIGVDPLVLYILDLEQQCLVPVPGPVSQGREPLPIQGTIAGRAFSSNAILKVDDGPAGRRLWLPLLDGTERLGLVEMTFPDQHRSLPEALVALCERFTHLIATLISNKDLYSDFFKILRRRWPMTSASELVWELVPPQVLATDQFVLGALLEPCY